MLTTYNSSCCSEGMFIFLLAHCNSFSWVLLQLLEAVGAILKSDAQKATSWSGNYQDLATAPLSHAHDDAATMQDKSEDINQQEDPMLVPDLSINILLAVEKVHILIILCTKCIEI